jgi:hypothetical protein
MTLDPTSGLSVLVIVDTFEEQAVLVIETKG